MELGTREILVAPLTRVQFSRIRPETQVTFKAVFGLCVGSVRVKVWGLM